MTDGGGRQEAAASEMSRRSFLRLSGAVCAAVLSAPLMQACQSGQTNGSSQPGSSGQGATAPGASTRASVLPAYQPFSGGPTPEYVSQNPRVVPGFEHYPKDPFTSWTKDPPGSGSNIDVFTVAYYPPPTPYDQNPTWQEVNRQLAANVRMNIVASSDYQVKIGTLMAGNDLPDLIHLYRGVAGAPNLPEFIQARCADLTPYLAGDAIKDYPNLAAIPTYAWKNSLSAIDGKLYQWPIHRYLPGLSYFFKNTDIYDQAIGATYVPHDAADLKRVLRELNRPDENRWAIGNVARAPFNFGVGGFASMFGAPNVWGQSSDGKLIRDWESEPFKAAVGYMRDLWAEGLMWSNAPVASRSRPDFAAGRFALSVEGFGNSWNDFWRQGLEQNPPQHFDILKPFTAHAGDKPRSYLSGGYISTNVMKKASPDRIRELLRVVDWLAAPFGSQEDLLLTYGLPGLDHTIDEHGDPRLTPDGNNRAGYVPWRYTSQHPYVQYQADLPGYTRRTFEVEQLLVGQGVEDVTLGYYSKTNYSADGGTANQTFLDGMNDIILGRRDLSEYDGLVQNWRAAAGDRIRAEYEQAMESASKGRTLATLTPAEGTTLPDQPGRTAATEPPIVR
jgi:putative aldouronate transport system substrate-binding protein